MSAWNEGYQSAEGYSFGYYQDLSPAVLKNHLLLAGYDVPEHISSENGDDFTYLELGFGQGVTLNAHAATYKGAFYGTDFIPSHALYAQSLARDSQNNTTIFEDSFQELLKRDDLPQFDMIVLHGIYSWVNEENRTAIRTLIQQKLKTGGIVYISYNAMPGWAAGQPIRELMQIVDERTLPANRSNTQALDHAFGFMDKLQESGALYFSRYPAEHKRLDALKIRDKTYLSHEFLNTEWHPFYFRQIAQEFSDMKMDYAASLNLLDLLDHLNLPPAAQKMIDDADGDIILQETVRDYLACTQFRRDIFTRGLTKLSPNQYLERILNKSVILMPLGDDWNRDIHTLRGKMDLKAETVDSFFTHLRHVNGPVKIADLCAALGYDMQQFPNFMTSLMALMHKGAIQFTQDDNATEQAIESSKRFNDAALDRIISGEPLNILASPVTATGVQISPQEAVFVKAIKAGADETSALLDYTTRTIGQKGLEILKSALPEDSTDPINSLSDQLKQFAETRLLDLKRLQII